MERGIDSDTPLEYATFQISPEQNRYEVYIFCKGRTEKLSPGLLEHLVLNLSPDRISLSAKSNGNFRLELPEELSGAHWFTKSTLSRFLHMVEAPEVFSNVNAILEEFAQLEEARNFQLSLCAPHPSSSETTDNINSKETGQMQKVKTMMGATDSTKNELLRAMDVRIAAIKKELPSSIARAAGDSCSIRQITDLADFCGHFGSMSLRNSLIRCLSVCPKSQTDYGNGHSKTSSDACQNSAPINLAQPENIFGSPTKVIQEENHSFIEKEESFNSSEEDQSREERSRASIRSATPRRSASPMRRVQVGRSGSRRSTALTIKSLGSFPAREKISSYRAAVGASSEDEEPNLAEKKSDSNTVHRMSVQDAINLFESKQRDQKSDFPSVRTSVESSVTCANKSVLRRWSAGMGEPSITCGPEGSPQSDSRSNVDGLVREQAHDDKVVEGKVDAIGALTTNEPTEPKTMEERDAANQIEPMIEKAVVVDRTPDSAEWTRQKEEELNQMLMKMMETKPKKYQSSTATSKANNRKDQYVEKADSFYGHYKEKRDEKLQGENNGRKTAKEAQLKAMYGVLDQRKAEMATKTIGTSVKRELAAPSQKAHGNALPPVNGKKETPKPVASRKTSTQSASPLPATRSSWPSTRSIAPLPTKISSGSPATGPKANRHKSQPAPAPSLTRQPPKAERFKSQLKETKLTKVEKEQSLKEPDQKKQLTISKTGKSGKTKPSTVLAVNSCSGSAKPKFDKKVTKKSTVVPLETRPSLRKGAGLGSSSATSTKTKTVLPDGSAEIREAHVQVEEVLVTETAAAKMNEPEVSLVEKESERYQGEASDNTEHTCEHVVNYHLATTETYNYLGKRQEVSHDALLDEESSISPAAWVDPDPPNELTVGKVVNNLVQMAIPVNVASASSSSLHIHHSLSQMLQTESCEPNIVEWGNAENPPALIYQKDSPKGFKRLLKFARKAHSNVNNSSSHSFIKTWGGQAY